MPSPTEAAARTDKPSMDVFQGWVMIRTQLNCLASSVTLEVQRLYEVEPTSENNQALAEVRQRLADLLGFIRDVRQKGGAA